MSTRIVERLKRTTKAVLAAVTLSGCTGYHSEPFPPTDGGYPPPNAPYQPNPFAINPSRGSVEGQGDISGNPEKEKEKEKLKKSVAKAIELAWPNGKTLPFSSKTGSNGVIEVTPGGITIKAHLIQEGLDVELDLFIREDGTVRATNIGITNGGIKSLSQVAEWLLQFYIETLKGK